MEPIVEIEITAPSEAWVTEFARGLVDDGLVACANVHPVHSVFRWEGKTDEATEGLVVLHTRESLVDEIHLRVDRDHPDDLPAFRFRPTCASEDYQRWVIESTRGAV